MKIDQTIRNLLVAVLGLALLLAVGVVTSIAARQPEALAQVAPKAGQDEVSNIELSRAGQSVSLHKQSDGQWEARGEIKLPASGPKIADFLNNLYSLSAERKVATSADHYAELGMGDADAVHLVLRNAMQVPLAEYWFGGKAADANAYVRMVGDPAVWQLKGAIAPQLKTLAADWADKRLWTLPSADSVTGFGVGKAGAAPLSFAKDGTAKAWKGSGSVDAAKASPGDIESLLRQVFGLEADTIQAVDDAAYQAAFKGMEKAFSLSVNGSASQGVELWRKKSDASGPYLVKTLYDRQSLDGKRLLLSIPAYRVGDLKLQVSAPPPKNHG